MKVICLPQPWFLQRISRAGESRRLSRLRLDDRGSKVALGVAQWGQVWLFARVQAVRQGEQKTAVWQVVQK